MLTVLLVADIIINGDKCRGQSAFAKESAQQIGNVIGNVEGVVQISAAKEERHHLIANQPQDTA
ncbi:hypothetical protein DSECCO2_451790 [anaerobic digester metagenome]